MGRRRKLYGARFPEKITKQVCSLMLAQKLKAVEVPQDSLWYWVPNTSGPHPLLVPAEELAEYPLFQAAAVSAFTAGELGELLPSEIEQQGLAVAVSQDSPRLLRRLRAHAGGSAKRDREQSPYRSRGPGADAPLSDRE
jgi:hypothetical protein